jgi:peptidyl-prolyl cis-trans isomerase SurA
LDLALMNGVQASDEDVAQGINNVSQQSGLDEDRLKSQIQRDGLSWEAFKTQIRNQITLQKLREREVTNRIRPTDNEIQAFIRENEKKGVQQNIRLAHILVVVPETANEGQINTLKTKAENAIARVRTGEEFAKVAQEVSEATDARQGGDLGLRPSDRYPEIFTNAVSQIKLGEVVGPLRSGAGWHILKLIDRQSGNDQDKLTTQTRARHILLKIKSNTNANTSRAQLSQIKQQIDRGAENFAEMAKKYSEDGSADKGGDLGWATPGMFVPEFEEVMNRLAPGQISEPLTSRFGVHLIQVMERRQVPLFAREIQERARAALRESKLETAFEDWARGVRGRAYVEYREEPQ